jgi:uncharacterized protein YdaU (DUF1376 family)
MADFPALPLWTDAFLADTGHLTPAENSAYLLLLMAAWRTPDCSLPNDDKQLGRITRDPRNWPRVRPAVMAFWTLGEDGRWRQKRLTQERAYVQSRSKKQADNARTRWSREQDSSSPGEADSASAGEDYQVGGRRGPLTTPNELTNNEPDHATASLWHMPNGCQTDAPIPIPTPTYSESPIGDSSSESAQSAPTTSGSNSRKGNGHGNVKDRGTRLPIDWQPGAEHIAIAESFGLDAGDVVRDVGPEFRDFWVAVPGARGRKLDWLATWRNRCRYIAQKRGTTDQRGRAGSGPPSVVAAFGRVLDRGKN